MKLTQQQRRCVEALETAPHLGPDELGTILGTSKEGAAATASSLVRKGLVERRTDLGDSGRLVRYRLRETPATSKCRACRGQARRHTCGLAGLQNLLRLG